MIRIRALAIAVLLIVSLQAVSGWPLATPVQGTQVAHVYQCCPPAFPSVYAEVYRKASGHWQRATSVELGDALVFVLRFRAVGFPSPSAHIRIYREQSFATVLYEGRAIHRGHLRRGYTRFVFQLRIPHSVAWLGSHQVAFVLSNGHGASIAAYLRPPLAVRHVLGN